MCVCVGRGVGHGRGGRPFIVTQPAVPADVAIRRIDVLLESTPGIRQRVGLAGRNPLDGALLCSAPLPSPTFPEASLIRPPTEQVAAHTAAAHVARATVLRRARLLACSAASSGAARGRAVTSLHCTAARRGVLNSGWGFRLPDRIPPHPIRPSRPLRRREACVRACVGACARRWSFSSSRAACGGGGRATRAALHAVGKLRCKPRRRWRATQRSAQAEMDGWRRAGAGDSDPSIGVCLVHVWLEESTTTTTTATAVNSTQHMPFLGRPMDRQVALRIHLEDRV